MRNYHSVAAIFRTVAVIALIPSAVLFGADRPPLRILFERSTRLPTTDLQGEIKPLLEAGKQPEAVERSVEHLLKLADYAMKHGAERPVLMISNMPTFCSELGQWRYFFKRWPIQEAIWKALPEAKDDAARLRRGILAHLLGHDDEALKTFREWLAKHPDSSVIATRLADILIQRDDGEAEAVRVLTPVTDTPDDYALATWATAMRMQRGARVSIHFARVTAALLDAMPVSAAWLGWAEEALRAVVEGQFDDEGRGMLPSLLADEKAVPAGEPLRADREAAMEELLDAMRRHPRLAMSALPFLARKPYSRGEDITMLTDEAFASLKRGLEDAPRGSFSLWMHSPWLEEDLYYPETSTTMHCPTVAEMLIYSAWKKQDIKKLESEALPVLKRVLSKDCYEVVQARAVLYFSAEEDFLEQAARWHTMRHSTTTPKQEMTLEHVRPITFVARLRGLKTAEQALLRDAVQIEVARGTVLDQNGLASAALVVADQEGAAATRAFFGAMIAGAVKQGGRTLPEPLIETLRRMAAHHLLYLPLLQAMADQGLAGTKQNDELIMTLRNQAEGRKLMPELILASPFLCPAVELDVFSMSDHSTSALSDLCYQVRFAGHADDLIGKLSELHGGKLRFGTMLVIAELRGEKAADARRDLFPFAGEFAALPVEKQNALWPAVRHAFPGLDKTPAEDLPEIFHTMQGRARSKFHEQLMAAQTMQDTGRSAYGFEKDLIPLVRELAQTDGKMAREAFLKGVELARAKQKLDGWWTYGGDGINLASHLLEEFANVRRNHRHRIDGDSEFALALDLLIDPAQRQFVRRPEVWHADWHEGLDLSFLLAGGAGDSRVGLRAMFDAFKHERQAAAALIAAPELYEVAVKFCSGWRLRVMRDEAAKIAKEHPSLQPLSDVFIASACLADWTTMSTDEPKGDSALRAAAAQALELVATLCEDEGINPLVRVACLGHFARIAPELFDVRLMHDAMSLMCDALEHDWPSCARGFGYILRAFNHRPRDEAWTKDAARFRAAWMHRIRYDLRNQESHGDGFWPQIAGLSAAARIFAECNDLEKLTAVLATERKRKSGSKEIATELARSGHFAEALPWCRRALEDEAYRIYVPPATPADHAALARVDGTGLSPEDAFALKAVLCRSPDNDWMAGRAPIHPPDWIARSTMLGDAFLKLVPGTAPDVLRRYYRQMRFSPVSQMVTADWARTSGIQPDWCARLYEGRRDYQKLNPDLIAAPASVALAAALRGDDAPWKDLLATVRGRWHEDEKKLQEVIDHLSWDAHATIGNWLPGRTPEEMRRVIPVVTALIREWRKYPSDGALAGCVLLLNGICIGLHDERTLRDTWSTLPPVAREIGRNAGRFALHWDDVTCSLSMATATQETRRPLETRLRLVTGLGRSEAVGDALREMPEVIRRARHVGVLTRAEVCDHASQLLHSMPLLSVLGNLVDGFDEIGDSNGALNLIRTALEDSPLSGNGWALLLCGSYAAEHGEKELARKCLSLLTSDVIQQTAGKSKTGQYSMEQGVGTLTSLCDRR